MLPLSGALSILLGGKADDLAVKRASIGFALLALLVVYASAASIYDATTGALAATLLGLSPWFWVTTNNFLSELPLLAFFCVAVVALYHGCYTSSRAFYLAWIGFGLAFLTRYTALLFGPVALTVMIVAWMSGDLPTRRRLRSVDMWVSPLVAVVLLAPWFIYVQRVSGNVASGILRASSQLTVYLPDVSMPWHFYATTLVRMISIPAALLIGIGALVMVVRRDRFATHCLAIALGIVIWFSCYRYKEARLISAALPLLAIVAASALATLSRLSRWHSTAAFGIAALTFVLSEPVSTFNIRTRVTLGYPSFMDAMDYLKENSSPGSLVVGPNPPQIWWYGERHTLDFPERERLIDALDRAEWVVITNFERGQKRYVRDLATRLDRSQLGPSDMRWFRDDQFTTLLVRARALRALVDVDAGGAQPGGNH